MPWKMAMLWKALAQRGDLVALMADVVAGERPRGGSA